MATTIGNLMLDGGFTDWRATDFVERPENTVANYQVYGALVDDARAGKTYVVGIKASQRAGEWLSPPPHACSVYRPQPRRSGGRSENGWRRRGTAPVTWLLLFGHGEGVARTGVKMQPHDIDQIRIGQPLWAI